MKQKKMKIGNGLNKLVYDRDLCPVADGGMSEGLC